MNNLHVMQKHQEYHPQALRWMNAIMPIKLKRLEELHKRISHQDRDKLMRGPHAEVPDKLRISMVEIQTKIRKQRRQPVVISTNTRPFQLMSIHALVYPEEETGKHKHALVLSDHATKSK